MTRRERFNAAHKLYNPNWTKEKNEEVFGVCANANWHGHNFELFVTVKGNPHPDTGMIINVKELGAIVKREVINHVDHRNLNEDVEFTKGIMPTTENLVKIFWKQIEPHLHDCELHCVKLCETENIYAEYYGE